jgi:hypothetical protein
MNLDDLVQSIPDSEADLRHQLALWIGEWKRSEDSIEQLNCLVGKWHGNVWFKETDVSNKFHQDWTQFKTEAIEGINGMTMNERLYAFGLFALWDSADEKAKSIIRAKLKANV